MLRRVVLFALVGLISVSAVAQKPSRQTTIDTSFTDYDFLFNELDAFLDSLITPRNFTLVNLGMSNGYFNYETPESYVLQAHKKIVYTPSISYFTKSGLGISGASNLINDGRQINPYQYSVTGSYDFMKNRKFITGVALTHFFTRSNLPFYTSPLQNGAYAYFTYRNGWLRPSIGASYGWGSRSEYSKREEYISSFRLKRRGYTTINTRESINDFNLIASVRHDFYWLSVLWGNDFVRFTPQLSFISGTQKFGINQSTSTYATVKGSGVNVLYNSGNTYLDDNVRFQPLSLTAFLKTEYAIGKFFIQPQLFFDYYFPANEGNLSTAFVLNAGVIF